MKCKITDRMRTSAYVAAGSLVALLPGAAVHADGVTPSLGGLGANGGPAASDYLSAGEGFQANVAPILLAMLPLMLLMMAVWNGPKIIKKIVHMGLNG